MIQPANERQLIITADDCGLSEGINESALELYQMGLLTTATVMMNFNAAQHAVGLFQNAPLLNVGVHLNLTDGFPLSTPTNGSLTGADGRFQGRAFLFPRAIIPTTDWLHSVENELTAQIETFADLAGYIPDHITTHMHFHILPSLRAIVFKLAEQYGIQWVRAFETSSTVIPYNFLVQQPTELFQPDNLKITPDYIASAQAWMNQDPERLLETMLGLKGLFEIVVHPDYADDNTYPIGMAHSPSARAKERDYLLRLGEVMAAYPTAFIIADPVQRIT